MGRGEDVTMNTECFLALIPSRGTLSFLFYFILFIVLKTLSLLSSILEFLIQCVNYWSIRFVDCKGCNYANYDKISVDYKGKMSVDERRRMNGSSRGRVV